MCIICGAHSSAGQSNRLITERSQVQALVGPPLKEARHAREGWYMDHSPFKQFIDLVTFDQALTKFLQQRRSIAENLADLYDKKNELLDEQDVLVAHMHEAKKQAQQLEQDMQVISQQEKEVRDRFHGITNNKEFQSLKKEADHYKEQQYHLEQQIITAWNTLEAVQKKLDVLKAQHQQLLTTLEEQEALLTKQEAEVEQQIAYHEQERRSRLTHVPEEWLSLYERMKHSVPNPVVALDAQGNCSACFSPLGKQDLFLVTERHKLLPCPSCFRLLYSLSLQEEGRGS